MQAKVDPYLRPLYDALDDLIPVERIQKLLETRTIEVAPLAFMRGRTLGDSFVILDEAQNATGLQDEDVPDASGCELQDCHHRRQNAGRSATARRLLA